MTCPDCGAANRDGAIACSSCARDLESLDLTTERASPVSLPLPRFSDAPTGEVSTPQSLTEWTRERRRSSSGLASNAEIGNRYRVIRPLGEGGMGAVYLVYDKDLDRQVALKLILPQLGEKPQILERFKREILLSTRVTNSNVLRVYDLGESEGVKYLTMEYVDGETLADTMEREKKLPFDRIVDIFRQVCGGLAAAHAQGIVHRDLKPQNIMIDGHGKVFLTDFGLAKATEQVNLTASGSVIGTPDYMSPEQVKGTPADHRSDIYSLGIILYKMLTGDLPFGGNSAYEIMMQRLQKPPRPVRELNPNVPQYLVMILDLCLAMNPDKRYQSLEDVLRDLGGQSARARPFRPKVSRRAQAVTAVVLIVTALLATFVWRVIRTGKAGANKPLSILIADFKNETGEEVFDGTLEPLLGVALEGAPFITSFNRGQARKVAAQLQSGASTLSEPVAKLVAGREGINVIISGAITRKGEQYSLSVRAVDAITSRTIASEQQNAATKDAVLSAAVSVAATVRAALGDSTPESIQLAAAETVSAASVEAAHAYAEAQELQWSGNFEEGIARFSEAIRFDSGLGRAYAGRAVMYANLGQKQQAEADYKLALARLDRMTEREKFRTRGGYYLLTRNADAAIEELTALIRQYPSDTAGLNNLALAYFYRRDMARAMSEGQKVVRIYPKNALYRNNVALYAMYAGDFKAAEREARAVLELSPSFVKAYVALALSQLAQGHPDAADRTYTRLAGVSARGASFASSGRADVALYEGRLADAISLLRTGADADRAQKNDDAAAHKLATVTGAELAMGHSSLATATARQAITGSGANGNPNVILPAARTLIGAGEPDDLTPLISSLAARFEPEPQFYAKLIDGERKLHAGKARDALSSFTDAQKFGDAWLGRFDLGRAYLALGAYAEASSEFERCLKRHGEASAVFLDDLPTYHLLPAVHYYLGLAQEGLGRGSSAESFRTFLSMRSKSVNDPMVIDARKRLSAKN